MSLEREVVSVTTVVTEKTRACVASLPVASPSRLKNLSHKTDTGKKQTGKTTRERERERERERKKKKQLQNLIFLFTGQIRYIWCRKIYEYKI
jgi:hypothetical protein